MMTLGPICVGCVHLHRDRPGMTCDAFPNGIPAAIQQNRADHRRPYGDDGGIRFEAKDAKSAEMVEVIAAIVGFEAPPKAPEPAITE